MTQMPRWLIYTLVGLGVLNAGIQYMKLRAEETTVRQLDELRALLKETHRE